MAPASARPVARLRAASRQIRGPLTEVGIRHHRYRVDEPRSLGGEDSAPTPMEHVLGAVGPCLTVVLDLVARERGWSVRDITTAALAEQDRRGLLGEADVPPRFLSVRLDVCASVPAPEDGGPGGDALSELTAEVERRCPVMTLLRDAGVASEVTWTWSRGAAA